MPVRCDIPTRAGGEVYSDLFGGGAFDVSSTVTEADAKTASVPVPKMGDHVYWPYWKVALEFSAGTTKTADLRIHWKHAHTGRWHAHPLISVIDDAATTEDYGQSYTIEAPGPATAVAFEIAAEGSADVVWTISVVGAAIVDIDY